ncbi:DUF3293 domain-containing protein [Catenovulum sp. 2E275]|uniref:DUF3293 domain-containing protein n=1 Tax=Catenovulum sp. 2E275 TaxID=2980497 RepID=UPI0021D31230|nr:DUF3293 domain-containing protein [Catenovulum sp. 2E275]MCU4675587.1 DUF3293 domain-containing protein [Catenovulum sp. 2E275]
MKSLWQLYSETVFLLEQPLGEQIDFAIITAYNPKGQACTLGFNRLQDKALQADITNFRTPYRRLWGCSPQLDYSEKSWAVSINKQQALTLATKYQQNALYWVEQGELFLIPCMLTSHNEENLGRFKSRCQYQITDCCT